MSHVNFNECIATYMDLYHMSYSKVSKCKIAGNNSTTAIKLTGDESRCNEFIDNYIENHSVGIELPNTPAGRFTNSIHDDNVFNNVTTKIPYKVSSSDEPQIPYAVSRIPNTGFRLYVTTQFDDYNTARTVHYFRHSGKNSGKKSDWFKVSINEEQFSD